MFDQFSPDLPDVRSDFAHRSEPVDQGSPLPEWVKQRILRPDEEVATVRGPRFNPPWEKYLTHIGLFGAALAFSVALIAICYLIVGSWDEPVMGVPVAFGLAAVFGSVCVLAACSGYFTRLVVTNQRVMIVQGYEVRRTWKVDDLPPFLVRQQRNQRGETSRTVDMSALTSMMGGSPDGFTEAKTIWELGKQIDRIRKEEGQGR